MSTLANFFNATGDLDMFQMSIRAFFVFLFSVVLIRISGRRSFALKAPFDTIILILLGALLSRSISGSAPFFPVLASSLTLCVMHRLLGMMMIKFPSWESVFKGRKLLLYKHDKFIHKNMKYTLISEQDIKDELAYVPHINSLKEVGEIYILGNGKLSFIEKDLRPVQ